MSPENVGSPVFDDRAYEAAARAIHEARACHPWSWELMPPSRKADLLAEARAAIAAAWAYRRESR